MSKALMGLLVGLGLLMGCGEEGDGAGDGGGCERPEGPPTMEADYCQWGPMCGECAFPGEIDGYYEASPDRCSWVEVWRQPPQDLTREQYERQAACNAAQDWYDNTEDFRSDQ